MFVKPSSAFVGKPSLVASSSGSAKKARYATLFPSTRKRSDSRAGASSRSSSIPVSVFGISEDRGYRPAAMAALRVEKIEDGAVARRRDVEVARVMGRLGEGV